MQQQRALQGLGRVAAAAALLFATSQCGRSVHLWTLDVSLPTDYAVQHFVRGTYAEALAAARRAGATIPDPSYRVYGWTRADPESRRAYVLASGSGAQLLRTLGHEHGHVVDFLGGRSRLEELLLRAGHPVLLADRDPEAVADLAACLALDRAGSLQRFPGLERFNRVHDEYVAAATDCPNCTGQ